MNDKQSSMRQPATSERDERLFTTSEQCTCQTVQPPLTRRERVIQVIQTIGVIAISVLFTVLAIIGGSVVALVAAALWA